MTARAPETMVWLDLDLGRCCERCGYLEVFHSIDGDERAPCEGFLDPATPEATP